MGDNNFKYEYALSFSGTQMVLARNLYRSLTDLGHKVFFQENNEHEMLGGGKEGFEKVYSKESHRIVVLICKEYGKSRWTELELQIALARLRLNPEAHPVIFVLADGTRPDWLGKWKIHFDLTTRELEELTRLLDGKATSREDTLNMPPQVNPQTLATLKVLKEEERKQMEAWDKEDQNS